jgi:uncharacterized protein involved in response to NO
MGAVMQITDLKKEQQIIPLFRLGFRPCFLFGAGFSIVAMALWALALQGINATIFLITLVMTVVGGRVMPMFTANGTQAPKVVPIKLLEMTSLVSVGFLLAIHLFVLPEELPKAAVGLVFLVAGLSNFIRCARWRIWVTLKVPLVWSLHIAYYCISIGLILMALSYFSDAIPQKTALHLLTVGGMGGLILAMTSRVSLGHTGRMLELKPLMPMAFAFLFMAALLRVVGVFFLPNQTMLLLSSSAV